MKYEKKIIQVGGSQGTIIPKDVLTYLELEEGSQIVLQPQHKKHGKFLAIWKKEEYVEGTDNE